MRRCFGKGIYFCGTEMEMENIKEYRKEYKDEPVRDEGYERYKDFMKCINQYLNNEPYMNDLFHVILRSISDEHKRYAKEILQRGFEYIKPAVYDYLMGE